MDVNTNNCTLSVYFRDKLRKYSEQERESRRNKDQDALRFGLGEIHKIVDDFSTLTTKDVAGLASRIKRRKRALEDDMFRLNHAFLQNEDNIIQFVNNTGALNIIVKELTGNDAELRLQACEVLCNISLGPVFCCEKVSLAAGIYLVTYLDVSDERLKRTCIWTIDNIASSGTDKGLGILLQQGVIFRLASLITERECVEDIINALDVILKHGSSIIPSKDTEYLIQQLLSVPICIGNHLKLIFNLLSPTMASLPDNQVELLVSLSVTILENIKNEEDPMSYENKVKILYSIRILSNLLAENKKSCYILGLKCINLNSKFSSILNNVLFLNNSYFEKEIFWLIGNYINIQNTLENWTSLESDKFLCDLKIIKN